MVCIIKSVSINKDEDDFLKDYKLSPSQLLKEKIWEMKGIINKVTGDKIAKMQNAIEFYCAELEKKDLEIEALNKQKENDVLEEKETGRAEE